MAETKAQRLNSLYKKYNVSSVASKSKKVTKEPSLFDRAIKAVKSVTKPKPKPAKKKKCTMSRNEQLMRVNRFIDTGKELP